MEARKHLAILTLRWRVPSCDCYLREEEGRTCFVQSCRILLWITTLNSKTKERLLSPMLCGPSKNRCVSNPFLVSKKVHSDNHIFSQSAVAFVDTELIPPQAFAAGRTSLLRSRLLFAALICINTLSEQQ